MHLSDYQNDINDFKKFTSMRSTKSSIMPKIVLDRI
jgi:hypothetical protein